MQLFGQPTVILKNTKRLHVSKTPGLFSWAAVLAAGYVGDLLSSFFLKDEDTFYRFLTAVLCTAFALWKMETWQDLVVDREACLVTMLERRWYHCLWIKVPDENITRFPSSQVTCVLVSDRSGVDILKNDGSVVGLAQSCTNVTSLREIRQEISTFLRLELMEELPSDFLWNPAYLDWTSEDVHEQVPTLVTESDTETLDTSIESQSKT